MTKCSKTGSKKQTFVTSGLCENLCGEPSVPSHNVSYPWGSKGLWDHFERVRAAIWQRSCHQLCWIHCKLGRFKEQTLQRFCPKCPPGCNLVLMPVLAMAALTGSAWPGSDRALPHSCRSSRSQHAQVIPSSGTNNILHFSASCRLGKVLINDT